MHIITIQETFLEVVSDVESGKIASESIWVARRNTQNEVAQEFYDITVSLVEGKLALTEGSQHTHKIALERSDPRKYIVTIIDALGEHTYPLFFPKSRLNLGLRASKISSSAITPDGTRLVVGTDAGNMSQYNTETASLVSNINGAHLADISHISVLPSSLVMMTVGLDLQTKLWPMTADSEVSPARVFAQQKGQITDLALIDRGRNFLTASLDGSVCLWECSTAQVVSKFTRIDNFSDPATCMTLAEGSPISAEHTVGGDLLHGCESTLVYVGYKSGVIQQYSVAGHFQTKVKFQRNRGVTTLCTEGPYLVAGYDDGLLVVYDGASESNGNSGSHWNLQLNPNFPIAHASVRRAGSGLKIVVSNGPELLVSVKFNGKSFEYSQLVGLSEMFRIVSIGHSSGTTYVATENDIVQY